MKKFIIIASIFMLMIAGMSCTSTIPMQVNLSDQTMLLAENRNVAANYTVSSAVPDGNIKHIMIQKNGVEYENDHYFAYPITTALNKIWDQYFESKFNPYAGNSIDITINLLDFYLTNHQSTSFGAQVLLGNAKMLIEATMVVEVSVIYGNEKFGKTITITTSEYNEVQSGGLLYNPGYKVATNPTQQKAALIDDALNKTIVQFENFLKAVFQSRQ